MEETLLVKGVSTSTLFCVVVWLRVTRAANISKTARVMFCDRKSVLDVSADLVGSGSISDPWLLSENHLKSLLSNLNWTRKTVYFPAGVYFCDRPIRIDMGEMFPTEEGRQMLREGVRFRGEGRASVIQFRTMREEDRPIFQLWWSRPPELRSGDSPGNGCGGGQVPLFFWEFSGLNIKGDCMTALVQLGGADVEETPWNSCEFHFAVNNGCMLGATSAVTGPARGVVIRRALESSIYLVATCAKGIGAVLESCEFCIIRGSFSNAELRAESGLRMNATACQLIEDGQSDLASSDEREKEGSAVGARDDLNGSFHQVHAPSGFAVTNGSIGLFMRDCCSNCCLSVNFEVAFLGVRLVGSCRGNVFNSVISNNCDSRGTIVNDDDCCEMESTASNLLQCVVRREVRQGGGGVQEIGAHPHKVVVGIMKT